MATGNTIAHQLDDDHHLKQVQVSEYYGLESLAIHPRLHHHRPDGLKARVATYPTAERVTTMILDAAVWTTTTLMNIGSEHSEKYITGNLQQ